MSNFLDNYEDVNSRIKRFREAHPSGRIETHIVEINIEKGWILIEARAFREYEDLLPSAIDFAFETRSDRGVNQNFWIENCSTSAIGRCIGLLMPSDLHRPTVQDMEKAERVQTETPIAVDYWSVKETTDEVINALNPDAPSCRHGSMSFKSGTSNKTGKEYHGYVCASKDKLDQCRADWYVLTPGGQWKSPNS